MKTRMFLLMLCLVSLSWTAYADETVTVTATSADISENLDLKTVATLFGQAKDLEEFESMLNNPDSAFSNLDLNGDGQVDYLRVIETADANRHLVVLQAVLAKDVFQDVASIYVEKDPDTQSVTVQVIGDEYIYGTNYIIEPVYIYRPYIYDWFWGPDWVCWYSPYYWDFWPGWWHPYYCVTPYLYWDHCYWHHYHYPICSYRTGHTVHANYRPMYQSVSRSDYAVRHPERSFATRNANRGMTNARSFDVERRSAARTASTGGAAAAGRAGVSSRSAAATSTASRSFGSSNIRTSNASSSRAQASAASRSAASSRSAAQTRTADGSSRAAGTSTTRTASSVSTRTTSTPVSRTATRSNADMRTTAASGTSSRASVSAASTSSRSAAGTAVSTTTSTRTQPAMSARSSSSFMRTSSSSSSSMRSSSGATMRSSSSAGSSMRSSGGGMSGGSRSGGGSSSRSGGGTRR